MSAKTNIAKLPEWGYGVLPIDKSLIIIKSGEPGYYKANPIRAYAIKLIAEELNISEVAVTNEHAADYMNKQKGISKAQREALEIGSMFGWDVPGADPDGYLADGSPNPDFVVVPVGVTP